jgi:hypothetical protein
MVIINKKISRGNPIFHAKCLPNKNSLVVTINKKQIVDPYKLKQGDVIILKYIKKINLQEEGEDEFANED